MDDKAVPSVAYSSRHYTHLAHCDCACALEPAPPGPAELRPGLWVRQKQVLSLPLGQGWQACFNPLGPVGVAALNPAARELLARFDHPTSVPAGAAEQALQDLVAVGLLQAADAQFLPEAPPTTLSAWLHVTEACNLNCPYCYVRKQPRTMHPAVGRRAVDRLIEAAQLHGHRRLRLKYAGGEPTLNLPVVFEIHDYAFRRAETARLELEEVLLTNGTTVDDSALDALARAGLRLMVSLDGGPAAHDRLRPLGSGGSSHAAVTGLVDRALARGFKPDISITITALNLDGVSEAVSFALERDLPFNLNFYRACSPAGPHPEQDPLAPPADRLVETILDVFQRVRSCPDYAWPLSGILDRVRLDLPHEHACSAGRDYIVVDAVGRVSACQMLLGTPWSDLGQEDVLGTVRQRGADSFRPAGQWPTCRDCPWRTACAGGCPLTRGSALHAAYCGVYRAVLPELVKLEGKRLVRQQAPPA